MILYLDFITVDPETKTPKTRRVEYKLGIANIPIPNVGDQIHDEKFNVHTILTRNFDYETDEICISFYCYKTVFDQSDDAPDKLDRITDLLEEIRDKV